MLEHLEPFKGQVNLSAQAERMLYGMPDELEYRAWAERNAQALVAHGEDIAATGVAGEEFERI